MGLRKNKSFYLTNEQKLKHLWQLNFTCQLGISYKGVECVQMHFKIKKNFKKHFIILDGSNELQACGHPESATPDDASAGSAHSAPGSSSSFARDFSDWKQQSSSEEVTSQAEA